MSGWLHDGRGVGGEQHVGGGGGQHVGGGSYLSMWAGGGQHVGETGMLVKNTESSNSQCVVQGVRAPCDV